VVVNDENSPAPAHFRHVKGKPRFVDPRDLSKFTLRKDTVEIKLHGAATGEVKK
jgi:hypothetical protein